MRKLHFHEIMITVSIMLATVMQVLDTTIANVALPHMQGALGARNDQIAWVLTSYIVATAIMTLPVGYLAQRYGRRQVMLIAVAGFVLSSMLCGQAGSMPEMVLWRILQGASGAALVPLSQSTLLDTFPREMHSKAMGLWGMGVILGPILGPTLGGWLTEYYSWRWVFYINVPVGVISLVGIYFFVPDNARTKRRFDTLGFAFLALAIAALQLLLDRGELVDWFEAAEIRLYAIAIALGLWLFVVHTATTSNRFLDPALLRDRNYLSCLTFIFLVGIMILATMALLPPYLQQWKGYPVFTAGLVLMPRGIGTMITMMMAPRLMRLMDPRLLILTGMGLVTLSLYLMSGFTLQVSMHDLVVTGIVQGLGLGLVFIPVSTLAYSTLATELRNEGTALFSLMRNLGSSVGISVMMALLARNQWINQQDIASRLQLPAHLVASPPGTDALAGLPAGIYQAVSSGAAEIAFANDFHLLMLVNLVSMPLVMMIRIADDYAYH